jgi:hypothetical protein
MHGNGDKRGIGGVYLCFASFQHHLELLLATPGKFADLGKLEKWKGSEAEITFASKS